MHRTPVANPQGNLRGTRRPSHSSRRRALRRKARACTFAGRSWISRGKALPRGDSCGDRGSAHLPAAAGTLRGNFEGFVLPRGFGDTLRGCRSGIAERSQVDRQSGYLNPQRLGDTGDGLFQCSPHQDLLPFENNVPTPAPTDDTVKSVVTTVKVGPFSRPRAEETCDRPRRTWVLGVVGAS